MDGLPNIIAQSNLLLSKFFVMSISQMEFIF